MSLLIQNGEVVTVDSIRRCDILCEGETITRLAPEIPPPPDAEIIDARGKFVFPGFIDPHVHTYLPFMGTYAKDTFATASQAALIGGTTSFIEMCVPSRGEDLLESFNLWNEKSVGHTACDWSYHMGVPRFDAEVAGQLRDIVAAGVASFKIFLAYKDFFGLQDDELYAALALAKSLGVLTTAHCENASLVAVLQQQLLAEGKTGPEWHYHSRPPIVEAEGVHHLCTFAAFHNAPLYLVHTSCGVALDAAYRARERGQDVFIETVIPYLVCDQSYAERPDFEGAKWVMSPPIRDTSEQERLWSDLAAGLIQTVATDHAPFDFAGQKSMGADDFTKIPNGIPSIEDRVNLLYTYGVDQGRIDLQRFVGAASTEAARIFGLYPRKGTIAVGSDADLVVYDPDYRGVISAKTHSMNVDYSGFEGVPITGRPSVVTVRGKVQVRDGQFVGTADHGKFLARDPGWR